MRIWQHSQIFCCAEAVAELSSVSMPNVVAVIVAVFTIAAFVLVRLTLSVAIALRPKDTPATPAWP